MALIIDQLPHLPVRFGEYDGLLVLLTFIVLPVPIILTGRYGPRNQPHVEMTRVEPNWRSEVGVFGEQIRIPTVNREGRIKLRLMATALANDFLEAAMRLDQFTYANKGPLAVVDLNSAGKTSGWSTSAYILGPPSLTFGESATFKEWDIICEQADMINGSMLKA